MKRAYKPVKRILDLTGSAVGIVVTAPVQIIVAAIILVTMGRPILFLQRRAGRFGDPFLVLKFRTMRNMTAGVSGSSDEDRLTRVGRFLRSTSLDELPSLANVFSGDMSLVGPRPLHLRYVERYSEYESRRLEVKPGLTGLAQVNGRNAQSWQRRFELDVSYVDSASLSLDARILARTVLVVIRREGISADDSATMPEFLGSADPEAP